MDILPKEADVLKVALELWEERASIDLDLVDGAFYWRVCRGELTAQLTELLDDRHDFDDRELLDPDRQDHLRRTFDHLHLMNEEIPGLSEWIEFSEPPRMRDPLNLWFNNWLPIDFPVMVRSGKTQDELRQDSHACISIGIRNSEWRGHDVESALRKQVTRIAVNNANYFDTLQSRANAQPARGFGISFNFFAQKDLTIKSPWVDLKTFDDRNVTIESPVIVCTTPYPFSPEGLIAASYDHIVIGSNRWHEHLYGFGAKQEQEPETAIRTWAIGLLVGMGLKYRDAERKVHEALNRAGGTYNSQFNVDRDNLCGRVPEAKPYVYQRVPKTRGPRESC